MFFCFLVPTSSSAYPCSFLRGQFKLECCKFHFFFLWYNNHIFLEFYRYTSWLSTGLTARKTGNTSTSPGFEWAVSAVAEDFIFVCVMP